MNAVISETKTGYDIGIRHADSRDCCAAWFCFSTAATPTISPKLWLPQFEF